MEKITKRKVAGVLGLLAPPLVLSLISLAILSSPWFSWTKNALSDLGVRGIASVFFNFSLIIGGVFMVIFVAGLRDFLGKGLLNNLGTLFLMLDAASLCSIGIFPETAGSIHLYVSIAFFTLLPISFFLLGAAMLFRSSKGFGLFTILAGVLAASVWFLQWEGVAIPEMVSSLALSAWSMTFGVRLLRGDSQK